MNDVTKYSFYRKLTKPCTDYRALFIHAHIYGPMSSRFLHYDSRPSTICIRGITFTHFQPWTPSACKGDEPYAISHFIGPWTTLLFLYYSRFILPRNLTAVLSMLHFWRSPILISGHPSQVSSSKIGNEPTDHGPTPPPHPQPKKKFNYFLTSIYISWRRNTYYRELR